VTAWQIDSAFRLAASGACVGRECRPCEPRRRTPFEDQVARQVEAMKAQRTKIEDLASRVTRLKSQLQSLTSTPLVWRLKSDRGLDSWGAGRKPIRTIRM